MRNEQKINSKMLGYMRSKRRKAGIEEQYNYKILRAGSIERLEKKVQKRLKDGWQLAGGVSVCGGYAHAHFHQAIFRGRGAGK